MGKASSSKKVARAAGIGGGRSIRRQRPWGYFGIIGLIVVLGLAGTVFSRHQRDNAIAAAGANGGVTVGSTSFEVYTVDLCGTFTYIKTPAPDPHGITAYNYTPAAGRPALTDGGVIQIAPTNADFAGANATLGKFTDAVGMKLNAAAITMPGGKQYLANSTTCNGTPGVVYVKQFANAQDSLGKLYNGGKGQLAKLNPIDVPIGPATAGATSPYITIAFVPPSWATATCPASSSSSTTTSTTTGTSSTTRGSSTTNASSTTTTTAPAGSSTNPATVTGCIPPPNSDLGTEPTAANAAAQAAASSSTSVTTIPATSATTLTPATTPTPGTTKP